MDAIIEKQIYKELSHIMTQDMRCECEVIKVYKEPRHVHGTVATYESIPCIEFNMGSTSRKESGSYSAYMYSKARELYKEYKKGDFMKVMFVAKKNRVVFDTWYNYMDVVKKHRKIIIACESPLDFCHKFDPDKMGPAYTAFYFDKDLGPAEIYECIAEFKHHYKDDEFKYIIENKLRTISMADMIETNDMSKSKELKLETDVLIDLGVKEKSMTIKETQSSTTDKIAELEKKIAHFEDKIEEHDHTIEDIEKKLKGYDQRLTAWSAVRTKDKMYENERFDDIEKRLNTVKEAFSGI